MRNKGLGWQLSSRKPSEVIFPVIAGLDPAIHMDSPRALNFTMDARVKPGHDEIRFINGLNKKPRREAGAFHFIGWRSDQYLALTGPLPQSPNL
jgi:hypothetical protein